VEPKLLCVSENLPCAAASASAMKGELSNEWRLLWIKPCEARMGVAILKAEIVVSALKSAKRLQILKLSCLYTHRFLFMVKPVV